MYGMLKNFENVGQNIKAVKILSQDFEVHMYMYIVHVNVF